MILYEKKIVYLSLYQDGTKRGSAGFAKISKEKDAYLMDIHIKVRAGIRDGRYSVWLAGGSREIDWGMITLQNGIGDEKRQFYVHEGFARFGEEEFAEKDICGILIRLDGEMQIAGYWQETESRLVPARELGLRAAGERMPEGIEERAETKESEEPIEIAEPKERLEGLGKTEILPEPACDDKWKQLQKCYKKIHPFGDERVFLTVEPKDFIILRAPYQRLVNNSFLLHGFYNYRHMILGPDKEIGEGDEICFYLGVPGTYFEREKMVAIMFGFEGFECDGPVEVGKFGYYMRRVEL